MFFRFREAAIPPRIVRSVAGPAKQGEAPDFARDLMVLWVTTRDMHLALASCEGEQGKSFRGPAPAPPFSSPGHQFDGARGTGRADAAPAMRHAFLEGLRPTLHIAHRGGAHLAPENTLPAFRAAVERWRTDMLELDLHATRDGELVVSHDPTVQRCTDGDGRIADQTFAELQRLDAGFHFSSDGGRTHPFRGQGARMPTFREVLRAFPGLRLNVEVKAEAPGVE